MYTCAWELCYTKPAFQLEETNQGEAMMTLIDDLYNKA